MCIDTTTRTVRLELQDGRQVYAFFPEGYHVALARTATEHSVPVAGTTSR